jgi:hypothetical protein
VIKGFMALKGVKGIFDFVKGAADNFFNSTAEGQREWNNVM